MDEFFETMVIGTLASDSGTHFPIMANRVKRSTLSRGNRSRSIGSSTARVLTRTRTLKSRMSMQTARQPRKSAPDIGASEFKEGRK